MSALSTFSEAQLTELAHIMDARLKPLVHENSDHLDRALLLQKVSPKGSEAFDLAGSTGSDVIWQSAEEWGIVPDVTNNVDVTSITAEVQTSDPDKPLSVATVPGGLPVDVSGSQVFTSQLNSYRATTIPVVSNTVGQILLPSMIRRGGGMIYNNSTSILYVLWGSADKVSTTFFTVAVQPSGFYEVPPYAVYSGELSGAWASSNGNAMCTQSAVSSR